MSVLDDLYGANESIAKTRAVNMTRAMTLLLFFVLSIACVAVFAGCACRVDDEVDMAEDLTMSELSYQEDQKPNADQIEVARSLGFSETDISEMSVSGMSLAQWRAIVPAAFMLDMVEKRYQIVASAVGMTSPWALDDNRLLEFKVLEGPGSGAVYNARMNVNTGEMEDDYYNVFKQGDFEALVKQRISLVAVEEDMLEGSWCFEGYMGDYVPYVKSLDSDIFGDSGSPYAMLNVYVICSADSSSEHIEDLASKIELALIEAHVTGRLKICFVLGYLLDEPFSPFWGSYCETQEDARNDVVVIEHRLVEG